MFNERSGMPGVDARSAIRSAEYHNRLEERRFSYYVASLMRIPMNAEQTAQWYKEQEEKERIIEANKPLRRLTRFLREIVI